MVHWLPPSDTYQNFLCGFFVITVHFTKELPLQKLHIFPRSIPMLQFMIPNKTVLMLPSPHKFVGQQVHIIDFRKLKSVRQ
jgi:hypothetical protein